MIERQEIFCHDCQKYVQFNIDVSLNGNHVLDCPNCGHQHCRVVENGVITDVRWGQRNQSLPTHQVSTYGLTSSATSFNMVYINLGTSTTNGTGTAFLSASWANTGTGT